GGRRPRRCDPARRDGRPRRASARLDEAARRLELVPAALARMAAAHEPRTHPPPRADARSRRARTDHRLNNPESKETTMIVEYIRYKIDPSRSEEFDDAYRRAGVLLDASPHCLSWELARCVDDPGKQIVRIAWDSVEGHLEGFRKSADFTP